MHKLASVITLEGVAAAGKAACVDTLKSPKKRSCARSAPTSVTFAGHHDLPTRASTTSSLFAGKRGQEDGMVLSLPEGRAGALTAGQP